MSNSDLAQLFTDTNRQINELFSWFCAKKLSLNANKTKYIVIRPKHKKSDLNGLSISIDNIPLLRIGNDCDEKAAKFLGLYIDEHLTWKHHIAHVNTKVSKILFLIKQATTILPKDSLRTLYFALVHSHYSYGLLTWGNASKSALQRSIILQKWAVRVINNARYNSHTDPLFKASGILKLNDLYEYQCLMFMFDYIACKLPISFSGIFKYNRDNPDSRLTRQSDMFHIARCPLKFAQNLPLYTLPEIWNKQARSFTDVNLSRSRFKYQTKNKFLASYESHVRCLNIRCLDCHPTSH